MCYAQTSGVERELWGQCLAAPCRAIQVVGQFTEFLAHKCTLPPPPCNPEANGPGSGYSTQVFNGVCPKCFQPIQSNTRLISAWNSWRTAALQQCSWASWTSVCCDFFPALFTNRCLCLICLQKSEQILLSCSGIPVSLPLDPVARWFKSTTLYRSCKSAFPSYQLMFWTCNKSEEEKIAFFGSKYFFQTHDNCSPKSFCLLEYSTPLSEN